MPLSRDTSSEVKIGSLREQCVWVQGFNRFAVPTYARMPMCGHVYVSTCTRRDYTQHNMDPSGQAFAGQVPVDGGSIREEDDEEGWCLLWCWVQQRGSSLLMKSHLRPPFTLNMGHCSCPDLGFDP